MNKTLSIVLGSCVMGGLVLGGCAATEKISDDADAPMGQKVTTFLMFTGDAGAAMDLYVSLFDDARVVTLKRHGGDGGGGGEGIYFAVFEVDGQQFAVSDSPPVHDFTFTPSTSLFVECESEAEIDRLHAALSEGGSEMMPLGEYPFAKKFSFLQDRFGVSWQLRLTD